MSWSFHHQEIRHLMPYGSAVNNSNGDTEEGDMEDTGQSTKQTLLHLFLQRVT